MRTIDFYRALFWLYPRNFREQFSEEMFGVFEQKAGELFAQRRSAPIALLAAEFTSIVRGASIMWMEKILPIKRNTSPSDQDNSAHTPLTIAEAAQQRHATIQKMVTAIAEHDFTNARRYSDEEVKLKNLLHELQSPGVRTAPIQERA